ncbi:hypothetical protein FKM82_022823 [Ascaphus truei]
MVYGCSWHVTVSATYTTQLKFHRNYCPQSQFLLQSALSTPMYSPPSFLLSSCSPVTLRKVHWVDKKYEYWKGP